MTGFQQMGYFHFGTGRNIYRHRVNLFVIPPDCNSGKPTLQNSIDNGIAAANEPIAMGIMRYLYEQKIRIPDDVSVIAYEDSVLGGYATPALTTVNIHKEQMGAIAANLLLKRMEAPERPLESRMVQPQLILRASVAQRK